jgi:hypothetical protein
MPYCTACGNSISPDQAFGPKCGTRISSSGQTIFPPPSLAAGIDADASTARTLTLIALVVQAVFFLLGLGIVFFLFVAIGLTGPPGFGAASVLGAFLGVSFLISVLWIVLDYVFIYRNLASSATIANARTPSILLGIVQLVFGGVIPGILLIIAYIKICDSMNKRGTLY